MQADWPLSFSSIRLDSKYFGCPLKCALSPSLPLPLVFWSYRCTVYRYCHAFWTCTLLVISSKFWEMTLFVNWDVTVFDELRLVHSHIGISCLTITHDAYTTTGSLCTMRRLTMDVRLPGWFIVSSIWSSQYIGVSLGIRQISCNSL